MGLGWRVAPSAKLRTCFDRLRLSGVCRQFKALLPQTPHPLSLSLSKATHSTSPTP